MISHWYQVALASVAVYLTTGGAVLSWFKYTPREHEARLRETVESDAAWLDARAPGLYAAVAVFTYLVVWLLWPLALRIRIRRR